jgi:hypothetical protein
MKTRNRTWPAKLTLLCGILLFLSCETGLDSGNNNSLPLAGPKSVQLTARDRELVAQWTKSAPAQGIAPYYEVYFNTFETTSGADQQEDVYSGTSNLVSTTLSGLTNFTTYYVWVKAIYPNLGESDYSPVTSAAPIPSPNAPEDLSITSGEAMLELDWETGDEPGEDATFSYQVYYKAGGNGDNPPPDDALTLSAFTTGIVLPNLTNDQSYRIWIRAVNTAGESAYISGIGTPAAAASAPANAPGAITVTPGGGKLTLTWDQVAGVPFYRVYYHTADNSAGADKWPVFIPAAAPTVSAEITGLDNGTPYYVWVTSANSQGESSYSPAASGTPAPKPPITWNNTKFVLGEATGEYVFAQDLPPSVFWPEGRPNTDRLTRVQETALGNLFTDAAAWYARNKLNKTFDFVFLNGGYIDNALLKGPVTVGRLSSIVQGESRQDTMLLLTLTGGELREFMDEVAFVVHTGRGGSGTGNFGVVSSSSEITYTVEYPKPPEGTDPPANFEPEPYYHGRIKEGTLTIKGQPIVDTDNYRILTTDYNASGVYFTSLILHGKAVEDTKVPFWRGVAEYIYDKGTITPYLDGRIKLEGGVALPASTGWVPGTFEDWQDWWDKNPWR